MENLELSDSQRKLKLSKEISHYWFSVMDLYNWQELFLKIVLSLYIIPTIPIIIFILIILSLLNWSHVGGSFNLELVVTTGWIIGSICVTIYIARIFGGFIMAWKLFYTEKWCIFAWELYSIINPYVIENKLNKYYLLPLNKDNFPNNWFKFFIFCKKNFYKS